SIMAIMKLFSRSPEKGAETLVWLADAANITEITGGNGGYYADKQLKSPSEAARDVDGARRLWEVSEQQARDSAAINGGH
ncbi:MAG: short chain dehydrogenase family protein, partial [Bacilli bacterium]|nr:short chain dehydrogenase family protein [Bacilli bacterium]